jgi:type II secretory ATPase GspE/PulE/Tfp pilus assembly ATPase PilB-like protein
MQLNHKTDSFSQELGSILLKKGVISSDQLEVALKEQHLYGADFEDCLLKLGLVSEGALTEALSSSSGYEKINLKNTLLDPSLKDLISKEIAEKFCFMPLSLEEGNLRIAIADVYNFPAFDYLRHQISEVTSITSFISTESDILETIDQFYGYDLSIPALLKEIENASQPTLIQENYLNPTIRLVNAILLDAIKLNASDIHFEPEGAFMRLRYRIDGLLSQICTLHSTYWPAICVRLKIMSGMNIAETRRPQNGRMTFHIGPKEIDIRAASHPTIHGENIVLRILDKNRSLLSLGELGYSEKVTQDLKKALQHPEGIFIVTGPTGCGKTTSLYSILNHISSPQLNIMTLEEPVEYQLPLIRQSDARELGGMGFEDGVKSILRQDPDIILIGEIRDPGTAKMALRAAMTGHQVFSTLHTKDALGAINRLVELGISRSLLATHLLGVIAQRLMRRLCPLCKEERMTSPPEMKLLHLSEPRPIYTANGCSACRYTGYSGRFAIAEILLFDEELNECLATESCTIPLHNLAQKKGFISMAHEARLHVLHGDTTMEEVYRAVHLEDQ